MFLSFVFVLCVWFLWILSVYVLFWLFFQVWLFLFSGDCFVFTCFFQRLIFWCIFKWLWISRALFFILVFFSVIFFKCKNHNWFPNVFFFVIVIFWRFFSSDFMNFKSNFFYILKSFSLVQFPNEKKHNISKCICINVLETWTSPIPLITTYKVYWTA